MTDTTTKPDAPAGDAVEHVDVLVVGAGISGVGAAYHLTTQCPERTFAVLERKETFGGTWHTHTYPGIRSDSDLYTFGYRFKPWTGKPVATGPEILHYMGEVIDENDLARHIRYRHEIATADWNEADKRWTVEGTRLDTGEPFRITATFLWMCQGYYNHKQGYTPDWPGFADFGGEVIHPQLWPDDVDLAGKRVVVIGSGATAATLIPNIAGECAHVTMLQRSPTFFFAGRNVNELADQLRSLDIPDEWTHEIVRRQIIRDHTQIAEWSKEFPDMVRAELLKGVREHLGDDFDIDTHFNPRYRPWQQRIAFVPDGDLFQAVRRGDASVVTDEIDHFTPTGIALRSGEHLDADVVITATGFDLCVLGDIAFTVDGEPLVFSDTVTYRGMMFTGVPNMLWVFGYFRASWTLRVDLIADFLCRLFHHMDAQGVTVVEPRLRPEDQGMELRPWVEADDFNPGYLMRSMHLMPHQGDHMPWLHMQDYQAEKVDLPSADLDDGTLGYR